ncbi:sensor histidine kinase [Nitratifractor sp.]
MKREIVWALFVFAVIIFSFFGIDYLLLGERGFTRENFLLAFALIFPGAMVVGYIFLSILLEKQQRQEERLERLVREVLHEIKLPIATIEANLEMIGRRIGDDERLRRRVERIGAASHRLQRLYREMAYELRREIAPVEREVFDLRELLEERIAFFEELGRNPIEASIDSLPILADRIGMEQVVDNLLENAMKYSFADRPIRISLVGRELQIADEGIGMDENEILRIYERYYQGDRQVRGEGIGLALVKRYCDDEGIGLRILSRKGEGTTVILDLERAKRRAAAEKVQPG